MKVSIITMTSTYNYGATLQAYALQEFIKGLGADCQFIDHMSIPQKHKTIKLTDISKKNLIKIPYKFVIERGYSRFETFYQKHMNMGVRYATIQELHKNPPDSDLFVTGSDQVWNSKDPKIDRFLLDFVPNNKGKISYAASIGNSNLPEESKQKYIDALKRFDAVSVREQQGYEMIQPLTDKKVQVNCDPAFLLSAEDWRSLEKPVKGLKKDDYILCYMLHLPVWFNDWIKQIKKQVKCKIVFVGLNGYRKVYCDKYIRDAGPGEFLWLIDNAKGVISSSFHGNVFSLIFGKDLISTPDKNRPDRIRNLLQKFNQTKRIKFDVDGGVGFGEMVDANAVEEIARQEREKSKEYLLRAMQR